MKLNSSLILPNQISIRIENSNDNNSQNEEAFVAATINNAIHELLDDHTTIGNDFDETELRVLLHTWGGSGSAPMLNVYSAEVSDFYPHFGLGPILNILLDIDAPVPDMAPSDPQLEIIWNTIQPDMTFAFGEGEGYDHSDDIKSTIYHEMVHVVHALEAEENWWHDYRIYTLDVATTEGQASPYGNGDLPNAGMAELAEGIAESFEHFFTDLQYGVDHSQGNADLNRFVFRAERLEFWVDNELPPGTDFIPEGLYFDLLDDNGVFPDLNVFPNEVGGVVDDVNAFTFEDQLDALGPDVLTVEDFNTELWQLHGAGSGNTLIEFNQLFQSYGF